MGYFSQYNKGDAALRAARERPTVPILGLTPKLQTARALAVVWGVHCVPTRNPHSFNDMIDLAFEAARADAFAGPNERIVIIAGVPFGTSGATNVMRIARIPNPRPKKRDRSRKVAAIAKAKSPK